MRTYGTAAIFVVALAWTGGGMAVDARAGDWGCADGYGYGCHYPPSHPDLFYNFYAPPCDYHGTGAQLYVAPRPTPPLVGQTYITYQALMPHEFLYKHHRTYYRYHPGSGVTKTKVRWW